MNQLLCQRFIRLGSFSIRFAAMLKLERSRLIISASAVNRIP